MTNLSTNGVVRQQWKHTQIDVFLFAGLQRWFRCCSNFGGFVLPGQRDFPYLTVCNETVPFYFGIVVTSYKEEGQLGTLLAVYLCVHIMWFNVFCYSFWCRRRALVWHSLEISEPAHKIMALFVLRKLILQTCMRSDPVGLDVWFLVGVWFLIGSFVAFHTSCVRTAKALIRAGSPKSSLVAHVISTVISCAGSISFSYFLHEFEFAWAEWETIFLHKQFY